MGRFKQLDELQGVSKSPGPKTSDKVPGREPGARRQTNRGSAPNAAADDEPRRKPPKPGKLSVFYDAGGGRYYSPNWQGEYQALDKDTLKSKLKMAGYIAMSKDDNGVSELEHEMVRIVDNESVHFAGPLGGYEPGVYDMFTSRVLVTRGPKFLTPKEGEFKHLRAFLDSLLADDVNYFLAWMKAAVQSLRRGPPWTPGQLLAIGGPPGCGKSFLQTLITPMLGGRVSSPFKYLASATNFNAEIYSAEHGLIGDVNNAIDPRSRRAFGASIKEVVAEPVAYVADKHKRPITLTPFLRITLTMNDQPQALSVLPSLDSDVADKILLLRARRFDWEKLRKGFATLNDYNEQLKSEMPAFIHRLSRWQIPAKLLDSRYTVISYHNPDLVQKVDQLSEEEKLLELVETFIFADVDALKWEGTSTELERRLGERMQAAGGCRLFRYSSHCGNLLETLKSKYPERVSSKPIGKNKQKFLINRE